MSRTLIVIALGLCATAASAQTASHSGIITQGRQCLDVPRNGPPRDIPEGTPVKVTRCNGQRSQRWVHLYGDYNHITWDNGLALTVGAPDARGRVPVVIGRRRPYLDDTGGTLRAGDRCATRRDDRVFMEPCRPGEPLQAWSFQ